LSVRFPRPLVHGYATPTSAVGGRVNILVVKPSSLGDIIHTLPAVALLRRHCPEAVISWLVDDRFAGILDLCPEVDDVVIFRRRRLGRPQHWHAILPLVRDLRQRRFDVALDFQGLLRSGLLVLASGAPRRVGFQNAREGAVFFYTERVPLPANLEHAAEKNLFLVRSAFDALETATAPEVCARPADVRRAQALFERGGITPERPLLAVAPGARWPSKQWPPEFFAAVLDDVATRVPEAECWLLGSADDGAVAAAVADACCVCEPCNLAGKTDLGTLAELLRRSKVLLTNDSGPMHLAALLGVPVVALFGPTDPRLTGPFGQGHRVFRGECDRRPCLARQCPLGEQVCQQTIAPREVASGIVEKLRIPGTPEVATDRQTHRPEPLDDITAVEP